MSFEYIQRLEREKHLLINNIQSISNRLNNLLQEHENIQYQNRILKDKMKQTNKRYDQLVNIYRCVVCLENPKNIILQPCFHFAICQKCLHKLDKCPICRDNIDLYNVVFD